MRHAVFPLTGDPIHLGHIDAINRASKLAEHLTVAFGVNELKSSMFSVEKRMQMLEHNIKHLSNVNVVPFDGMLVSFANEIGVDVIIKCLRDEKDYEYESILIDAGNTQNINIETIFLRSDDKYRHLSSTMVKGIAQHGGFIHDMVPLNVKFELENKMDKLIIGITGGIGCGKNYISEKLRDNVCESSHIIDFDKLVHSMYDELKEELYIKMRKEIIKKFEIKDVFNDKYYFLDRKELSDKVTFDPFMLSDLSSIVEYPLLELYKKTIKNLRGTIFLNCPLLIESGWEHLCNNNIIYIDCSQRTQLSRLSHHGMDKCKAHFFMDNQYTSNHAKRLIEEQIEMDNYGHLFEIDNSEDNTDFSRYSNILNLQENIERNI